MVAATKEVSINIPDTINEFLSRELPSGRNMGVWIFVDFPKMLEVTTEHHFDSCNKCLKELGYVLNNDTIRELRMDSKDFKKHYDQLIKEYDSAPASEEKTLLSEITGHIHDYNEAVEQTTLFNRRLWPTLISLKNGDNPDLHHLIDLDIVTEHHPFADGLEFYTDESWISRELKIPAESGDFIMEFLVTLRDAVRNQRMNGRAGQGGIGDI